MLLKISMALVLFFITAFADKNSQAYKDCSAKYTDKILQGDSEAFKRYIIECQEEPDLEMMMIYSNNSYRSLSPESLVCMGDIYSERDKDVSYNLYKIAAQLGSNSAKVSIGVMADDKKNFKDVNMDIDSKLEEEYIDLAKKDKSFNFLKITSVSTSSLSDEEKKKFETEYLPKLISYAKQCVNAVDKDIFKIENKIENMLNSTMQEDVSGNYEAWLYVDGMMLEDKKRRLKSTKRKFSNLLEKN